MADSVSTPLRRGHAGVPASRPSLRQLAAALVLAASAASALGAQIPEREFAARRAALVGSTGDGVVLVLGAIEPVPDYMPWQQSRPFYYLTGFREPGAALVMVTRGSSRKAMLFVQPRSAAQEVWTGPRLGVERVRARHGLEGRDANTLRSVLDSLLAANHEMLVVGDFEGPSEVLTPHAQFVEKLRVAHPARRIADATPAVAALRGRKSESEFERLRIAAEISALGHIAAFRLVQPGVGEFELQAAAEHVWRREGADGPGYASIVGSGPNATVLHYNVNARVAESGELVIMDMAAQFDGYSADITRTIPVSGRFTDAQREIYEVVLAAQKAAERQVRVGGSARAMSDSATAVLADGLTRLGLIDSPSATYDCGSPSRARACPQLGLFYMHGLGHGIGLDVHDPDQYESTGVIGVGSAFTIEPGIYVREALPEILPATPRNRSYVERVAAAWHRYEGIGVRIEDDYLVTAGGVLRPSAGVPRELSEVEALTTGPRSQRDPEVTARFLKYRSGRD